MSDLVMELRGEIIELQNLATEAGKAMQTMQLQPSDKVEEAGQILNLQVRQQRLKVYQLVNKLAGEE